MSVNDRAFPLACGITLAALAGLAALALVLWVSGASAAVLYGEPPPLSVPRILFMALAFGNALLAFGNLLLDGRRLITLLLIIAAAAWFTVGAAHSRTLYPGQYAQVDPAQRQWFQSQSVPGGPAKGASCCSEADGATAEEDIRGDHYWVRFTYRRWDSATTNYIDAASDWMEVPDEAILPTNHNGSPIVWWWIVGSELKIRCYARGSGI